jgi:hypothetical protein
MVVAVEPAVKGCGAFSVGAVERAVGPAGEHGAYEALGLSGDEVAAGAADSTGGFTFMVCALKALLEHDVVLTVVLDAHPQGLHL